MHTLGITPFRGQPTGQAEQTSGYYQASRAAHFERMLAIQADADGVILGRVRRCPGMWEGTFEPSYAVDVTGPPARVRSFAATMAARYNQDAVMAFRPDPTGPSMAYTVACGDADDAAALLTSHGFVGGRYLDGNIEVVDEDGTMVDRALALAESLHTTLGYQRGRVAFVTQQELDRERMEK